MKTLIDNLNFDELDQYSSRSLVAWKKRKVGTKKQQEIVKELLETRSKQSLYRLKNRVQINYKLNEDSSNKLKEICSKIKISKTFKILDKDILEIELNTSTLQPTDLIKVIIESNIEKLWRSIQ